MRQILIGGAPNSGKTQTLIRLNNHLQNNGFTIDINYNNLSVEILIILSKTANNGKLVRILINSATDDEGCIRRLKTFMDDNPPVDILITSIRDEGDDVRDLFFQILNITPSNIEVEIPLAKINRKINFQAAMDWYIRSIDSLLHHTLKNPPFNI